MDHIRIRKIEEEKEKAEREREGRRKNIVIKGVEWKGRKQ